MFGQHRHVESIEPDLQRAIDNLVERQQPGPSRALRGGINRSVDRRSDSQCHFPKLIR
jgi:hypothetical protein